VQKLLYRFNRDPHTRQRYEQDLEGLFEEYDLDDEERQALRQADIGMLYIMGVNGQLLMHYAAAQGYAWDDYIKAMRDALAEHGNVRAGLYATTDGRGAV